MSRLCLPACISGLITAMGLAGVSQADEPSFNTVRIDDRNYVNLADVARYYEFNRNWTQEGLNVALRSKLKWKKLDLRIDSCDGKVNGVRIWLNHSPLENRNSVLISEVDVRKTLDPVLRPWAVRKKKVKTVMIDPGHGGEDRGARGKRGSTEKHLTLDLAMRVEKLLKEAGFKVVMTRRRDTYISLEDRSELANSSDADLFVSLHFNSVANSKQPQGVETYCLTPVGLSSTGSIRQRFGIANFDKEPGNAFDYQNMLLAYLVQQRLLAGVPKVEDRGIKRARFFVIKATEIPSILIENGFLSHPVEEKRILTSAHRNKLAVAIVEGIKKYAELMNPS